MQREERNLAFRASFVGKRFGLLTVVEPAPPQFVGGKYRSAMLCQCDCGGVASPLVQTLRSGDAVSCGCFNTAKAKTMNPARHGHATRKDGVTPEYRAWSHMKGRCFDQNDKAYRYYGGRGITVHPEWIDSFDRFVNWIGLRPDTRFSLDRVDNDGNYEPGNVRWATRKQQSNNRRPYGSCLHAA